MIVVITPCKTCKKEITMEFRVVSSEVDYKVVTDYLNNLPLCDVCTADLGRHEYQIDRD